MSTWTYVMGIVNVGTFSNLNDENVETIKQCLGKIVTFDDLVSDDEYACITNIPMGSEGSLSYEIVKSGYIIFDGRLRDFYGEKDIKSLDNYFKRSFKLLRENKIYVDEYLIKAWNNVDGEKIWKFDTRYD